MSCVMLLFCGVSVYTPVGAASLKPKWYGLIEFVCNRSAFLSCNFSSNFGLFTMTKYTSSC